MNRHLIALAAASLAATAAFYPSTPAGAVTTPTYTVYTAPSGFANDAGEPSIGNNWLTGATMFQAGLETDKVTWDAANNATWSDVSAPAALTSFDPILWTDSTKGRTIESQLVLACSLASLTNYDGGLWLPSQGCGLVTLDDHQTVGGGPYAGTPPATAAVYGHAVYYCAQSGTENCARSDDGGITFGQGIAISTAADNCAGLTGHIRVAPDGTAYVPIFDCGGKVAVSVSTDNGAHWTVRKVTTSTTQDESDPSIAAGSDNTLYMGWEEGASNSTGSKAYIGVSQDHGVTWTHVTDVGASFGINNVQFPEVIAGDGDRAAYAFLGTPTSGNDQASGFAGAWHLYVATTYDRGVTWTTVDTTPTDPVQKGCIWLQGGSSACRNLLDFNDITVDAKGRVLVGFADGCTGTCATGGAVTHTAKGAIVRLTTGTGLLAAFDGSF